MSTTQHVRGGLAGQHVDRGASGAEVLDHRRGHVLGPGRHALATTPWSAGEHSDSGAHRNRRRARVRDAGQPDGQVLQHTERPRRLGQ